MRFFRLMPVFTLCALMAGLVVLFDHAPTTRTVGSVNGAQRALESRAKRTRAEENRRIFQQLQMLESRAAKEMILF